MANCWRCGGQISSYAARCNWCGRSTTVSGFLQVLTLGVLVLAALVVGGVVPLGTFTRYLPTNWIEAAPLPAQTGAVPAGGGDRGGQGGGSAAAGVGAPVSRDRERPASRAEERQTSSLPDCDSPQRIALLAVRHAEWNRDDLALIACRKLREGFSDEQVVAAQGRPLRRLSPDTASGMEVWVYRDMRVVLERDRVVSIRQQ
jgi:hypothetical protein